MLAVGAVAAVVIIAANSCHYRRIDRLSPALPRDIHFGADGNRKRRKERQRLEESLKEKRRKRKRVNDLTMGRLGGL